MPEESKRSAKSIGRVIGVLLLLQLAAGLTLPFILLRPGIVGYPGFLATAAANSRQIRWAVFIAFVGAALTVALALAALPVFRRYSTATAHAFLAVCAISCTLDVVHNASVMSMLSLSQRYLEAGRSDAGLYQPLAALVASTRRWAHYTQLTAIGAWIFVFYSSLWRFRLVPRALASLGIIGILLQFTGVTLLTFLGYSQEGRMAMPLGPIHIAVAAWLMAKGFPGGSPTTGVVDRVEEPHAV
jgi:Domain of unknown function (DUF4386)